MTHLADEMEIADRFAKPDDVFIGRHLAVEPLLVRVYAMEEQLRQVLIDQVQTGRLVTYKELADRLGLVPPLTIHRTTVALEKLIEEDVAAGRPILAAFAVSKVPPNLPRRGFFVMAQALGVFSGESTGPEAAAFHALEVKRVLSFYKR
jgi:hypothetical protein